MLNLRLKELELLVMLGRYKSLRDLARNLRLKPEILSKSIQRAEAKIGYPVFRRTSFGVVPTDEGRAFLRSASSLLEHAGPLLTGSEAARTSGRALHLAAPSYLNTYVIAPALRSSKGERYRLTDIGHDQLISAALQGACDIAFHLGKLDWPRSWASQKVGSLRSGLFARAGHPLLDPALTESERRALLLKTPFVLPGVWHRQHFSLGQDFAPLGVEERVAGHEVSTAETALQICRASEQLAFVPLVIAREALKQGAIQKVALAGWDRVEQELYVSAQSARVLQSTRRRLVAQVQQVLREQE
jgi:DNA-binding transcriptional LysR family regulator